MDNIEELFEDKCKLPKFIKYCIYILKKLFCVLTIKEEKICIVPYKKIKNKTIVNLIIKIINKTTNNVVLSYYLNDLRELKSKMLENNIYIYDGKLLSNYLLYNFINYISNIKNEQVYTQEIFILVNNANSINESNIIYFAEHFKRINIVTSNINHFRKIENYLEEKMGIGIVITNNKRKSLSKARIIINLDFDEETLNSFNLNTKAIIISINNKINIKTKLFNGINICDYQIIYKNNFDSDIYKKFDKKLLYESTIIGKKYDYIINKIKEDDVKIVNLIGKNGIINYMEYKQN